MISIKQLQYFSAVAKLGHFGRAADFCNVTQPALSMQVRALEEALGIALIERGPQGAVLTPAGQTILERAQQVLAGVRDLEDYARHHEKLLSGALRLGVIPSIAPYILPPLLPVLRNQYQDLDLRIRETQTERLVDELTAGRLDVLLLALPIYNAEVVTEPLFEDPFLLAAPKGWAESRPGNSASAGKRSDATGVAKTEWLAENSPLLLLEEGHCLRDQALEVCQLRRIENLDTFGASSLSTIVQMVANGLGLTLLPEMSLEVEAHHGNLHIMPFEPPEPSRTIGLAWRPTSPRVADFAALGDTVREVTAARKLASCQRPIAKAPNL